MRYAQLKGYDGSVGEDTNILGYKDFDKISEYAIPALQWATGWCCHIAIELFKAPSAKSCLYLPLIHFHLK